MQAGISNCPEMDPDASIRNLLMYTASTVAAGGSVLLPLEISGVLFDLLEQVSRQLSLSQLATTPIFVVGIVHPVLLLFAKNVGVPCCYFYISKFKHVNIPFFYS